MDSFLEAYLRLFSMGLYEGRFSIGFTSFGSNTCPRMLCSIRLGRDPVHRF